MSQVCEYVHSVFTLLSFSEFNFKNVFATVPMVLALPCAITSCHTFFQIENFTQILSKHIYLLPCIIFSQVISLFYVITHTESICFCSPVNNWQASETLSGPTNGNL